MIKKITICLLSVGLLTIGAQAEFDKKTSYEFINQCQYNLDENKGKYNPFVAGAILGIAVGFSHTLRESGIDNNYASLSPGEYADEMCKFALWVRKEENKKTGGKYDVTGFYNLLTTFGYELTKPTTADTNTK